MATLEPGRKGGGLLESPGDVRDPLFRTRSLRLTLASMNARVNAKPSPVRSAREHAGLTREQLAVKAGVSSTTLYLAERAGLISAATAAKVARVLGVPAEELVS